MLPGRGAAGRPIPEDPPEENGLLPGRGPAGRGPAGREAVSAEAAAGSGVDGADGAVGAAGAGAAAAVGADGAAASAAGADGIAAGGLGAGGVGAAVAGGWVMVGDSAGATGAAEAGGPSFSAAAFFAGAGAVSASAGAATAAAGKASRSLRTTGGSMVEDADRTNSPRSVSLDITVLLSTPSSFASSYTRTLATSLLSRSGLDHDQRRTVVTAWGHSSVQAHRVLMGVSTRWWELGRWC